MSITFDPTCALVIPTPVFKFFLYFSFQIHITVMYFNFSTDFFNKQIKFRGKFCKFYCSCLGHFGVKCRGKGETCVLHILILLKKKRDKKDSYANCKLYKFYRKLSIIY